MGFLLGSEGTFHLQSWDQSKIQTIIRTAEDIVKPHLNLLRMNIIESASCIWNEI